MDANRLIAHRGDNTHYPENTFVAIEAALEVGAKFIEFDVQMNASGSLVVFHDADLKRMAGIEKPVFEFDDDEMQRVSIHEPEQFGEQHRPTSISTVDQVLLLLLKYPETQAFVEIKEESLEYWGTEVVMQALLKSMQPFAKQVFVISFSVAALEFTRDNSDLRIGLVFNEYSEKYFQAAIDLQAEFMICPYRIVPKEPLWQGDWQWMVYTLNEVTLVKEALERADIDLVETDDIRLMLNTD